MNLRLLYKWSLVASLVVLSQIPLWGQTEVVRYDATSTTGYGVVYSLPKTEIDVVAYVREQIFTPGELASYAEKYLGKSATLKPEKSYSLNSVRPQLVGVPNTDQQYIVIFDKRTIAPFLKLASGNIIYSINGQEAPQSVLPEPELEQVTPDRTMPTLPREYALATTPAKRAEIASAYLYEIRESLMNVLKGEAENMPKDGEAMRLVVEQLRREEARCLRLFYGDSTVSERRQVFRFVPEADDMQDRVIFRFTAGQGILPAQGQDGNPVYLNLKVIDRAPELSEKELRKRREPEGIVYNMPGQAEVVLSYDGKELSRERLPLTQIGTTQILSKKMFNIKEGGNTAVYFDLRTGAILNVRQD